MTAWASLPINKIKLPLPVGINSLYKQGRHGWYKDKKAVDWQTEALWTIKTVKIPKDKYNSVYITWFIKDKRKHDIDGPLKLLLDTLVKANLFKDDNDIFFLQVQKILIHAKQNYCEIELQ